MDLETPSGAPSFFKQQIETFSTRLFTAIIFLAKKNRNLYSSIQLLTENAQ
ncbi:hypothetical protein [Flavobacterium ovatum]|uniref:hypothetical protein n=1 Tax=Flavobacterium ovatum TaxID=1928857 RepID=UPI00344F1F21